MGQGVKARAGDGGDAVQSSHIDGGVAKNRGAEILHKQGHAAGAVGRHTGQQVDRHKGEQVGVHIQGEHLLHQPAEHRGGLHGGAVAHHDGNKDDRDQRALNAAHAGLEGMGQPLAAHQQEKQGDGEHLSVGRGLDGGDAEPLEQQAQADDGRHAEVSLPGGGQGCLVLIVFRVVLVGHKALPPGLQALAQENQVAHDERHGKGGTHQADDGTGHGGGAQVGGWGDVQGVWHANEGTVGHRAGAGGHGRQGHLPGHIQLFQYGQGDGQDSVLVGGHAGGHHQAGDDE